MKTLQEIQRDITIIKILKGSGHYKVIVCLNHETVGDYLETDMQQIDDISKLNNGFESELYNSETFEEVFETTVNRLERVGEFREDLMEEIKNYF